MSVDEYRTVAAGPHPVDSTPRTAVGPRPARLFSTRFLRAELWLIFGRRRNWAGLAVLAAVPVILAVSLKLWPPTGGGGPDGGDGPDFVTSITSNGLFVALAALSIEMQLFLPLAVATIAGDSIAGEANQGTLRYLLTVPVHRTRMLAVKYAAIAIFALVATLVVAMTGMLLGLALFGGGDLTLLSGTQVSFGEGLLRVLAVCGYMAAGLCALGAVGLFVSTLTEQPIGAAIAIVMLHLTGLVLGTISQLDWLHPYLLTDHWFGFAGLLRDPVDLTEVWRGLFSAGAYTLIFWLAAWARFGSRDVTS